MKEVPVCLQRRYYALDNLINELSSAAENHNLVEECVCGCHTDRGIKLMRDFWNILKEDPDCDLTQAVEQRMDAKEVERKSGVLGRTPCTPCYMASGCSHKPDEGRRKKCCQIKGTDLESTSASSAAHSTGPSCSGGSQNFPQSTVLSDFKEVASFDKNCSEKLKDLIETEKQLRDAIQKLEQREKNSMELLKQADCMWVCMEDTYKKKISESTERQKTLEKQLKDLETSTKKWRKNMKDLESEFTKVNKTHQEFKVRIIQKNSDIKCIDLEIVDIQKRLDKTKKDVESNKKSIVKKKEASDKKVVSLAEEVKELEKIVAEENKKKREKELEGTKFIKEARKDLQTICGLLLKKKLENEDLKAEKTALLSEIEALQQVREKCREKCEMKRKTLESEIEKVNKEIAECQARCSKCNECTDTSEFLRFCTDCPRCLEERRCTIEGDHCTANQSMDCVCTAVKKKFLDNVFENMYTVMERLIKKGSGKVVADKVLECLKNSRNGKLDERTRKALQAFILTGVKKHLNLTIVGGAVKTRCEMEPDTYKQLMNCLQKIQVKKPVKVDKGTASKKEPCRRWGGTNECHCPKGPKACICLKKAPRPPHDATPCPEDEDDVEEEPQDACHKNASRHYRETENSKKSSLSNLTSCDCKLTPSDRHNLRSCDCKTSGAELPDLGAELAKFRPESCQGPKCKFSKDMRTAPCVVHSDESATPRNKDCAFVPVKLTSSLKDQEFCDCVLPGGYSGTDAGSKLSNLNGHITKLAKSPSGALVIEFEEDILKSMKKKISANPLKKIVLKNTNSGHFSIEFISDEQECDVDRVMTLKNVLSGCLFFKGNCNISTLLNKTKGDFTLDNVKLSSQYENLKPNAVLRETSSGVVLVIATDPLHLIRKRVITFNRSPETYSKVKILNLDNSVIQFPGVLKSTKSQNYIVSVDKEFEKNFRDTVNKIIKEDSAVITTLRKSESNSYLLKFGCDIKPETNIGILKKSRSGNIKIILNDSNGVDSLTRGKYDSFELKCLTEHCIDLLRKLPNKNAYYMTLRREQPIGSGCCSSNNYQIPKKIEKASQIRRIPLLETALSEKRTVPLDETSKTKFIDRLRNYMLNPSKSSHIKTTISDSSILVIKRPCKNPVSMKITPSSNIYVLPNKQSVGENIRVQCSLSNLVDDDIIKRYGNNGISDKMVGTSPRSKLYDASMNQECKCARSKKNLKQFKIDYNSRQAIKKEVKANESLVSGTDSIELGKIMPYIVIEPSPNLSCIYHNVEHNTSLDNISSSGVSNRVQENAISSCQYNSGWDSLSFLPPQLPSFLGDVIHLYN